MLRFHDLDVVGRPDTFTVLAGLAAVTEHIGLFRAPSNSTFNEPYRESLGSSPPWTTSPTAGPPGMS